MDDHIDLARPRRFERSIEIQKEVVASSPTNDARTAGQVEPDVGIGEKQDAHVTPTREPTPAVCSRAEALVLTAAPRAHLLQRDV